MTNISSHNIENLSFPIYDYYHRQYPNRNDINKFIPIAKHYERCEEYFKYLTENYNVLDINKTAIHYPGAKYWLTSDFGYIDWYQSQCLNFNKYNIITTYEIQQGELDRKNIQAYHLFDTCDCNSFQLKKHQFPMYKTSVHAAIAFGYISGYKNLILIGVDLSENGDWSYPFMEGINRPPRRVKIMREVLYRYKEYINIYKTNKNNTLDLEYIDVKNI
jgi:hypothetical protein